MQSIKELNELLAEQIKKIKENPTPENLKQTKGISSLASIMAKNFVTEVTIIKAGADTLPLDKLKLDKISGRTLDK